MPSRNTYHLTWFSFTLDMGYLFMAAPAKRSCCSLPWTRGISSQPPLLTFSTPWTVAYQAPLSMEFSRQGTGVGCHFLLQEIFATQGSNPGLPHCRQMLYCPSHQGMWFTPVRKVINKKQDLFMWRNWNFCTVLVGMLNGTVTLANNKDILQKN